MSEADNPKTTFLFLFVIGSVVVLAGMVIAVDQFFHLAVREEISRKVLQHESTALRLLRSEEQARLTHYQWVDQKAGLVRLPVERAMALVLQDWAKRPEGFTPGTPDLAPPAPLGAKDAPAPAAAPAPEGTQGDAPKLDAKPPANPGESKPTPPASQAAEKGALPAPATGSPGK